MAANDLVTCDWLANELEAGNKSLVVLDVSWYSNKDGREIYLKEHIPGAFYFDIMAGADHTPMYPRNLPSSEIFQKNARSVGVNPESHVVVYSDTDKQGYLTSGRAWWMFKYFGHEKVSVLDGGWKKWSQTGNKTTSEIPVIKEGTFTVNECSKFRRNFQELQAMIDSKSIQVIDSRPADSYNAAHIRSARNVPADSLLDTETGLLKNKEQLKQVFESSGVDLSRPVATHCNSGMSSCTLALAASLAGCENWAVYPAGFTEWKQRSPAENIES